MKIDVNPITCEKVQLSKESFYYKYSYNQGWLVLHLARIDRVVENLSHFFIIFNSTLITQRKVVELK